LRRAGLNAIPARENIFENAGQNGQENLPEKKAEGSLSLF
jgi:hypothetical protein